MQAHRPLIHDVKDSDGQSGYHSRQLVCSVEKSSGSKFVNGLFSSEDKETWADQFDKIPTSGTAQGKKKGWPDDFHYFRASKLDASEDNVSDAECVEREYSFAERSLTVDPKIITKENYVLLEINKTIVVQKES